MKNPQDSAFRQRILEARERFLNDQRNPQFGRMTRAEREAWPISKEQANKRKED